MAMTATTNTSANTALRYLGINNAASASSLAKLSSGSRIVRASDDAASLAVGTKLKADVTALKQASVNASQASSVLQVADGALAQTVDILMRMKALSVQSQSGSVSDNERGFLQMEFQALARQIDSIAAQTKFNGDSLLDGTFDPEGATLDTETAGATSLTAFPGLGPADVLVASDAVAGTYQLSYQTLAADGVDAVIRLTNVDDATDFQDVTLTGSQGNPPGVHSATVNFSDYGISIQLTDATPGTALAGDPEDRQITIANGQEMSFQVGVASTDTIEVTLGSIQTSVLGNYGDAPVGTLADADGAGAAASITTRENAVVAGEILDDAIAQLNEFRADVGSQLSRFEFAAANLATTVENLDAARSVLMDVDMAAEMSNFSSKQVLLQASVAMLAQANQQPQQLLKLLG